MTNDTKSNSTSGQYLTSTEAVERLNISKSTLYAYVSRGLIRSEPVPGSPRTRRYRAIDVERLLNRQRIRSGPEPGTSQGTPSAEPPPESTISSVTGEQLYYRNQNAIDLAQSQTFEQVIALLWYNDLSATLPATDQDSGQLRRHAIQCIRQLNGSLDTTSSVQAILPILEQLDPASYDFRPETIRRTGMEIIQIFTAALVGADGHAGIARTLQAHWAPGKSELVDLLNAALILSTDHGHNASTGVVRCIAAAGAPLHSAITGGISAMRGQKLGGASLQVEAMIREVDSPRSAYDALRRRLQRGESLAGFGHGSYPGGDPRGQLILELMRERLKGSEALEMADAVSDAAADLQGLRPDLEFGMVMLCQAINLPAGNALSLRVLGQIAGWVAHAMEAYERNTSIEPGKRDSGQDAQTM